MILDSLDHSQQYERFGARFARAFRFLRDTSLVDLQPGRYEIDGNRICALVSDYATKAVEDSVWEAHRKHVDIQCVATGQERVGVAPLESLALEPYDDAKDVLFARGNGDFVTLVPGRFVLLFPQDGHMPGVSIAAPEAVRKVVIKIAI